MGSSDQQLTNLAEQNMMMLCNGYVDDTKHYDVEMDEDTGEEKLRLTKVVRKFVKPDREANMEILARVGGARWRKNLLAQMPNNLGDKNLVGTLELDKLQHESQRIIELNTNGLGREQKVPETSVSADAIIARDDGVVDATDIDRTGNSLSTLFLDDESQK